MGENGQNEQRDGEHLQGGLYFLSEFDHTLDSKGRISIPSSYRRIFERKGIDIVFAMNINDGEDICIRVYPPDFFRQSAIGMLRRQERDGDSGIDAKTRRELARKCTQLTVDKQGRISLTQKMCKRAQINKDVRIVGMVDFFEIWGIEQFIRVHGED